MKSQILPTPTESFPIGLNGWGRRWDDMFGSRLETPWRHSQQPRRYDEQKIGAGNPNQTMRLIHIPPASFFLIESSLSAFY